MKRISAFVQAVYFYTLCLYKQWRARKLQVDDIAYVTADGVEVRVYPGRKSPHDFKVTYLEPGKRERTPRHVHLIVEMYVKHAHNPHLTLQLRDHILDMLRQVQPVNRFPPQLQFFRPEHVERFKELDAVGEYTTEFLLVVTELIGIQEKTNYPRGSLTESLYADFGVRDRFSVIHKAVWR